MYDLALATGGWEQYNLHSGSGRVDMLTRPVAAAQAAVATGASVKLTHETYLIRGSVGA